VVRNAAADLSLHNAAAAYRRQEHKKQNLPRRKFRIRSGLHLLSSAAVARRDLGPNIAAKNDRLMSMRRSSSFFRNRRHQKR
jgi:hypothetical protein